MRRALAVLFVLASASAAFGTTYYVATNGSDSNPGTSSLPWATIQYAVETIAAGDTILVKPGSYAGCRIEYSGAAGYPKTLAAETGGTVLLNSLSPEARHEGILEIENYDAATEYWTIDGFEVDGINQTYRGIDSRSEFDQANSHITIKNCVVHHANPTGISSGQTHYPLLLNNVSYNNGEHGTYCNNSSDYGVERYNVCYSNTGCGMHHNGDKSQQGDGNMSYWLIEKNIAYLNPSGSGINCDGLLDSKIVNNLLYGNMGSGMSLYTIDSTLASCRDIVYNNTIVMPVDGRWAMNITANRKFKPYDIKVKNNILYNAKVDAGSIHVYSTTIPGFESDYNIVVDRFSIDSSTSYITLAQWQTYGYDLHSIISTPAALFIDAANDDYHLKSTSPAINAGTTLTEVVDDLEDYPRTSGSYDIGCYEYH